LLGAVLDKGDKLENAAVLATNTELEVVYSKQKLVPFGEFLPFRELLSPIISRFDRLSRDFMSGEKSQPIMMGGNRIGVLICFEVAFDEIWQKYGNADYLVVLTNNATYAETKQPIQQLRITRLQSIAQGKPVVIASTSGISAYIDERGEIRNLVAENKSTHFLVEIPKSENNAPSLRLQPILYIFTAIVLIYSFIRRRLAVAKKV
jgi:apolipoprotein N-acyltransferase